MAGDSSARQRVIQEHGPLVWSLCRRLDPHPEDAYQEIWEKVLRGLVRFDPDGRASLRTWIATVGHRHLVDRHRRRSARADVIPMKRFADGRPAADAELDQARRAERLEQALEQLPEHHRRVVVMHHLQGFALEDVAGAEEVAVGTIKSRLHRARARLAEILGEER